MENKVHSVAAIVAAICSLLWVGLVTPYWWVIIAWVGLVAAIAVLTKTWKFLSKESVRLKPLANGSKNQKLKLKIFYHVFPVQLKTLFFYYYND